jgi:hypothetical protein
MRRVGYSRHLLNPAGARPALLAGARGELRGLSIRECALAPAQDDRVVGNRRRVAAENAGTASSRVGRHVAPRHGG